MQSNIIRTKYTHVYYYGDMQKKIEQHGKPFQKRCGKYCYDKYHPVDKKQVLKLAYQYHMISPDSDPDYNYYKALQYLRSKVICQSEYKCCSYWDCKFIRERFSKCSS